MAAGVGAKTSDPIEKWEECIATDLVAVMRMCSFAVPYLERNEKSAIVNIASIAGLQTTKNSLPCMFLHTIHDGKHLRCVVMTVVMYEYRYCCKTWSGGYEWITV